jgi:hypothetical protein
MREAKISSDVLSIHEHERSEDQQRCALHTRSEEQQRCALHTRSEEQQRCVLRTPASECLRSAYSYCYWVFTKSRLKQKILVLVGSCKERTDTVRIYEALFFLCLFSKSVFVLLCLSYVLYEERMLPFSHSSRPLDLAGALACVCEERIRIALGILCSNAFAALLWLLRVFAKSVFVLLLGSFDSCCSLCLFYCSLDLVFVCAKSVLLTEKNKK